MKIDLSFGISDVVNAGINAIAQIVNTNKQIKSAEELANNRVVFDREIASKQVLSNETIAKWRMSFEKDLSNARIIADKEIEELRLKTQKDIAEFQITSQWRISNSLAPFPGKFVEEKMPNVYEPIIIFDTKLSQEALPSIEANYLNHNPIKRLLSLFRKQNDNLGKIADVYDVTFGLSSRTEAQQFCNEEFPNESVIYVYGSFTGTHFEMNAVYNGITADQFYLEKGDSDLDLNFKVFPKFYKHISLGEFPKSIFKDIVGKSDSNDKMIEDLELVFDCFVNTVIQAMIDQRFMFFPEKKYHPQAQNVFLDKFSRLAQNQYLEEQKERILSAISMQSIQINNTSILIDSIKRELLSEKVISKLFK